MRTYVFFFRQKRSLRIFTLLPQSRDEQRMLHLGGFQLHVLLGQHNADESVSEIFAASELSPAVALISSVPSKISISVTSNVPQPRSMTAACDQSLDHETHTSAQRPLAR